MVQCLLNLPDKSSAILVNKHIPLVPLNQALPEGVREAGIWMSTPEDAYLRKVWGCGTSQVEEMGCTEGACAGQEEGEERLQLGQWAEGSGWKVSQGLSPQEFGAWLQGCADPARCLHLFIYIFIHPTKDLGLGKHSLDSVVKMEPLSNIFKARNYKWGFAIFLNCGNLKYT